MRKLLAYLLVTVIGAAVWAQSGSDCPGFRNTTSFVTGSSNYFWSARVGDRTYSDNHFDTTTGYHIMSTCTAADPIPASSITSVSYNSGPDSYISNCGHNFFDASDVRFQIITQTNAGIDQFTVSTPGSGMQRIPPGYLTSIRLGDMRNTGQAINLSATYPVPGNNRGSEALFYTMLVTPANALLIINYAVVARRYDHSAYDAGEFLIRVVGKNQDGTWRNEPLNDSLWYKVSAPHHTGTVAAPWVVGLQTAEWPCMYVYKPWAKVAINLNDYIYEQVRVEMYTSDCIYNADPLYAYISGDFQPMILTASGCPSPESDVVDTLTAPSDMISYRWFASEDGAIANFYDMDRMDTVTFRQIYPATGVTTEHRYTPRIQDFALTRGVHAGDTVGEQTFMCIMTSALDPAKPVESKLYVTVQNRRPKIDYQMEASCDTTVTFHNRSTTYMPEGILPASIYWVLYADTECSMPLDTLWGNDVTYRFPRPGLFGVKLYCETAPSATLDACGMARTFVCEAVGRPDVVFATESNILCEGDVAHFTCLRDCNLEKYWTIDSTYYESSDSMNYQHLVLELPLGVHAVSLTAVNKAGCTGSYSDTVHVYGVPELSMGGDRSAICLGDTVTITAAGSNSFAWQSSPEDTSLASQQGQSTIVVSPRQTTTYYLLPSADNPCSDQGARFTINLIPRPEALIHASMPTLSIDNSTARFTDASQNRDFTWWRFSDGSVDSGLTVTHSFDLGGMDSVWVWMESCNKLGCCGDTVLWLPVDNILVWVPNVFIPGNGDRFGVVSNVPLREFEIYVYNREGLLVHRADDPTALWDGTDLNGRACPQGAYVYWFRYAFDDLGGYHEGHGTVTLLR
jgi:hypothetical protein